MGDLKAFNKITLMETYVVDESINLNNIIRKIVKSDSYNTTSTVTQDQ